MNKPLSIQVSHNGYKINTTAASFKEAAKIFYKQLGKKWFKRNHLASIELILRAKDGRWVTTKKCWLWLDGKTMSWV